MTVQQVLKRVPGLLTIAMLVGCTTQTTQLRAPLETPATTATVTVAADKNTKLDETAMLPLLGYFQLLLRLTPQELARERAMLASIPQTPATHVRMAMLLGLSRTPGDLVRAQGLLETVLKSTDQAAVSLFPVARMLANQYNERQKVQMQNEKLAGQNEQLGLQLKDSVRRGGELQEKLDALADIERTLPVRSPTSETASGSAR